MGIISQFTPNSNLREILVSLKYIFWPFLISNSKRHIKKLSDQISLFYPNHKVFCFDSGRTALSQVLKAYIDIGKAKPEQEVLVAGHTCLVVVNAIMKSGLKPVYVDFQNNSFQLDVNDLKSKVTSKTKFILIQHTFGFADDIDSIKQIAEKHNLILIEDLAHSFTGKYKDQYLGEKSDVAILSFGSNKILSCLRGGAAVTKDDFLAERLDKQLSELQDFPDAESYRYHLKHVVFYVAQKLYFVLGTGKMIMWISNKLRLIPKVITFREKQSLLKFIPEHSMSDSLAHIGYKQFQNIQTNAENRQNLYQAYYDELSEVPELKIFPTVQGYTHLFVPILVPNPYSLQTVLKRHRVLINLDWTGTAISPNIKSLKKYNFHSEDCPNAVKQAKQLVCLPLHQNMDLKKVKRVTKLIKKYYEANRA